MNEQISEGNLTAASKEEVEIKKRFFITGGGTGGHIYPAVAVANSLKALGHEVFYIGNPNNLEKEIAQKEGFEFLEVDILGMPRKADPKFIGWIFKLIISTLKSVSYIFKYKPDSVFGTGGYVSAPCLFASILTKTPFAIHDCDAAPGIVSKTAAPIAKFVSVAFEASKKFLKSSNVIVNGNPIRTEFEKYNRQSARERLGLKDKMTVIVMGGSQGAKTINRALVRSLEDLLNDFDVQIIHQTGKKNYDSVLKELEEVYPAYKENENYILKPYFDEMYAALKASDIAVGRAGSLSISEICMSGLASVLVPYPYAAADHQRKNAREMEKQNAAIYLEDRDCNSAMLYKILRDLIENNAELVSLQNSAKALAKPNATQNITNELLSI